MRVPVRDVRMLQDGEVDPRDREKLNRTLQLFERALNDLLRVLSRAVNQNEGSAVVVEGSSTAAFPTASAELRGRLYLLARATGSGAKDELYLCRKNAADAYEWALVTIP